MWERVDALLDEGVRSGLFAGCALVVRGPEAVLYRAARGRAELRPRARPAVDETAWDLASLTKVLCTTPVCMRLVERGVLDLDAPVCEVLDDVAPGVTARHLLQHASGLPAWRPLYREVVERGLPWGSSTTRARVLRTARTIELEAAPGERYAYSDLGFLTLCALVERLAGMRIDRLFEVEVRSLAGADLRWGWPGAAATEDCPVRGQVVVGTVHDLNAAVMGGLASHAGLFGSAGAVAAAAAWQLRAWLGAREGLLPETVRRWWAAGGPGSHHLGWDGVTPGSSSAGPLWPEDGVGHLGFTGCSVWVAPRQEIVVAFTSNRLHPVAEGGGAGAVRPSARYEAFRAFRPRLHTAIVQELKAIGRWDA